MKEKIKFLILVLVFAYLIFRINDFVTETAIQNEVSENKEIVSKEVEKNNIENEVSENKVSVVTEVTEETFEEEVLKSEKKVLIDFYADWCGPCKILSPIVEEVAKENSNLKVVKINVDNEDSLAYKYKAYSIPTLVVIENGEEVNRAVGAIPKEDVLELVK